ncbi:hypothetical protein BS50DRAFT_629107 [Corynespora cassiicola Philippines]|uniref:Uncharacterized protein n=1 Tax=Corynespora cassiicola Philippines TaxID=1448308 RepID=A0A2T2P5R7_CORCC|nr:hypothetical protein BS50DRAFT_629107 [Corynespora cassiicola Philippines]
MSQPAYRCVHHCAQRLYGGARRILQRANRPGSEAVGIVASLLQPNVALPLPREGCEFAYTEHQRPISTEDRYDSFTRPTLSTKGTVPKVTINYAPGKSDPASLVG